MNANVKFILTVFTFEAVRDKYNISHLLQNNAVYLVKYSNI